VSKATKPCPFCGSYEVEPMNTGWSMTGDYGETIICLTCEACGPWKRDEAEAWKGWNERKEPREH